MTDPSFCSSVLWSIVLVCISKQAKKENTVSLVFSFAQWQKKKQKNNGFICCYLLQISLGFLSVFFFLLSIHPPYWQTCGPYTSWFFGPPVSRRHRRWNPSIAIQSGSRTMGIAGIFPTATSSSWTTNTAAAFRSFWMATSGAWTISTMHPQSFGDFHCTWSNKTAPGSRCTRRTLVRLSQSCNVWWISQPSSMFSRSLKFPGLSYLITVSREQPKPRSIYRQMSLASCRSRTHSPRSIAYIENWDWLDATYLSVSSIQASQSFRRIEKGTENWSMQCCRCGLHASCVGRRFWTRFQGVGSNNEE